MIKKINLVVKHLTFFNSFYASAVYLSNWLFGKFLVNISNRPSFAYDKNVIIEDYEFYFRSPFFYHRNLILWLDSPLKISTKKHNLIKYDKIITTSFWNKKELESAGFEVYYVIGRLINPLAFFFSNNNKKEYDFIIIGNYDKDADRKYITHIENVLSELQNEFNFKLCAISNYEFNKIKNKEIFSNVDEYKKFELISKSKFIIHIGTGGFEIPLFEAGALGLIPVYNENLNAYTEFVDLGFKVSSNIEVKKTKYGYMYFAYPSLEHLKKQLKNALEMSKDKYNYLSGKIKEKVKNLMLEWYNKLIQILSE